MKNKIYGLLIGLAASMIGIGTAAAQSTCPYIATGAVLTAAQWNQCFANKQNSLGFVPVNKSGDSMLGRLTMLQSTGSGSGFNIPQGSAPSSPNNGDVWTTISGMYARINGATIGPFAGASASTFAATAPISVTFPLGVVTYALDTDPNFSVTASQLSLAAGGVAYPSSVTGGAQGAGTINASGLYVNGVAVSAAGITGLTGDVAATGPGSVTATIQPGVVTYAKFQTVAASSLVGNPTAGTATSQAISLGATLAFSGTALQTTAHTGDATSPANSNVLTLATVNSNVGTFGSATQSSQITVNGKGLVTAAANVTVTPAVGSITGLGTGVATALGVNVGSAGAFVTFNGAGGTPSSMVGTNITGTAAGLTAGNVTTNANLTGPITSVGNATSIASQTGTGTKFVVDTGPTISALVVTGSITATGLVKNADLAGSIAASKLVGTDIATVGTLTAGTASTGFTVQASNVTWTGALPCANLPTLTGDVTTSSCAATIASNAVTNAKLATMAAATIKMNPTSGSAAATDSTIQGLTNLASPNATLDFVPIYDHLTGTIKNATPAAIASAVVAGVSSINALTGAITIGPAVSSSGTAIALPVPLPQGRLTLQSGVPVMNANQIGKGTLYYDAYRGGNLVPYYDGTTDQVEAIAAGEVSMVMVSAASAGQVVSGQVYDVWWVHSGASRICLAMSASGGGGGGWASDTGGSNTARGTGYSQLDYSTRAYITNKNAITNCFNGATNYGSVSANRATYIGTIYATANGQTGVAFKPACAAGGTNSIVGVSNGYNRESSLSSSCDSTGSWTYDGVGWRPANQAGTGSGLLNRVSWVDGLGTSQVEAVYTQSLATSSNSVLEYIGILLNATSGTPPAGMALVSTSSNAFALQSAAQTSFLPQTGFAFAQAAENCSAATCTYYAGAAYQILQIRVSF